MRHLFERIVFLVSLGLLAVSVAGTKACQEDYFVGSQVSTPAPTAAPTDDDAGLNTRTPTESPEPTEIPDSTATVGVGATPTVIPAAASLILQRTLREVAAIPTAPEHPKAALLNDPRTGDAHADPSKSGNWLGQAFQDQQKAEDADGDGFSDWLEDDRGTNSKDAQSAPDEITTSYRARISPYDSDIDGLNNEEEQARGTSPTVADSDGDSIPDGIEVLSGSDPLSRGRLPVPDSDRDGLSNSYELSFGSDARIADTDGDGLNDAQEVIYGSDPRSADSDSDGLWDGKEIELGSDPLNAE